VKKDFYRPPSLQPVASRGGWREPAVLFDGRFPWAIPSFLHMGRKVVWAEMSSRRWIVRSALITKIKKNNFSVLATGLWYHLHCPHHGMKKRKELPLFHEETQGITRRRAEMAKKARAQQNHRVEICFHLGSLSRQNRTDEDSRTCLSDSRQERFLEARYSQLRLFQVHG
jgi:hypothetical protein